jgi:hypothetical protein
VEKSGFFTAKARRHEGREGEKMEFYLVVVMGRVGAGEAERGKGVG